MLSGATVSVPPASLVYSGGIPTSLYGLTSLFLDCGTGFQTSTVASKVRPLPFVVLSLVSLPLMSVASSSALVMSSPSAGTSQRDACNKSNAEIFLVDQPFVVSPGFSPVPAKMVNQMEASKYIDFSELLAANLDRSEQEPQLLLDGCLILTAPQMSTL